MDVSPISVADEPFNPVQKAQEYKALKEAFVSNLSGGTVWEINAVALVQPVRRLSNLTVRGHS